MILPRASSSLLRAILPSSCQLCGARAMIVRQASNAVLKPGTKLDEAIKHRTIKLVDPESSALMPPASLSRILSSLDRTRYAIQLVDESQSPPICRILDKKEAYQKAKAKKDAAKAASKGATTDEASKKKKKAGAVGTKEVQLTWGVAEHDLAHKLNRTKEFLQKGYRVQMVITGKRGGPPMTTAGREAMVKEVKEAVASVGRTARPQEVDGHVYRLVFEPLQ